MISLGLLSFILLNYSYYFLPDNKLYRLLLVYLCFMKTMMLGLPRQKCLEDDESVLLMGKISNLKLIILLAWIGKCRVSIG